MDNKKCYSCRFYKPYYTKGYFKFDKQEVGFCCSNKSATNYNETYGKFSNKNHVRIGRKQAALKALVDNLELFTAIRERKK